MGLMTKVAVLLAGVALTSAAMAQQAGSRQTREFVAAASGSDAFEIMAAQAALAQSGDRQVRAFAQQMIRDHGETSRALQVAAARAGLEPPAMAVDAGHALLLAALQSVGGKDFDKIYWRHQVLVHRSALTVQQQYAAGGDAPAIRQAAAAAVPLIQSHLTMAEQMNAKVAEP